MGKLIYAINLTLDGCVDHTKGEPTPEMLLYYADIMRNAALVVYGRKTYELMIPYWPDIAKNPGETPKAAVEYAQAFSAVPLVVFSRTLKQPDGYNTQIINPTNLREEILKLKKEYAGNIMVGGVDLPSQLTTLDLIDEYLMVVHPIMVGEGRRLEVPERVRLKLIESKVITELGCVALRYERRPG